MAAAAVDVGYLSSHLGVPETSLSTVLTDPTIELVQGILNAVTAKAHEFDSLYADKLKVEIEFESVVRSSEARSESFKAAAEGSRKEVEELRRKVQEEENARRSIENELQTLKSSSANLQAEVERLASRNASLEASNRDTLSILESKTSANAELAEELQAQHQKNLKLGQEITTLQQSVQNAQSGMSSAKFREQSLQQELEFARKNNQWFETELKTKTDESLKFRKEKAARIAELQRQNDEAQSTIDSLSRTEKQLRTRLEDAQRKADEALSKVQQLQEAAARSEEGFRAELESSSRLVELKEQQTETHRNRLREVELRLEQVKDESANEVRRVRQEMEQIKEDLQQAEQRAQQFEAEVDRLQAATVLPAAAAATRQPGSAPQTPRANGTVGWAASPFGTPGSILRGGKSSITAAQAMEELYKTRGELSRERRRAQDLSRELDEIMSALEAKSPEINDLQEEAERLRAENVQISQLCEESFAERDMAKKAAKKAEASSITAQAEIEILRTQLRDLSTQIQLLVFNLQAREKGLDELSEEEVQQFERLQRGRVTEGALDDLSDTHQFISERFVVFKDIQELQEKNAELLRVTRELANKMESDEASEAKRQAERDQMELKTLRDTVSRLQDESKSVTIRMKSYMTERDMFRRMLQQKAGLAEISSVLGGTGGQSAFGGSQQREVLASIEQSSTPEEGELTVALRELQNNFDSYRTEQGVDRQTMRSQVEKLSAERSSLQAEIARINSQLTLASERYEMLQSNYAALETDNKALQEKNQSLSESYAKQDIRTQQVAMDLVEVRSLLESMRNENANLKAEKTLWKGIQDRLSQDNESLGEDKARLNSLLASQQSLLNERELSESETRRRLQAQIDKAEAELTTTKRKLSEEVEEAKKLQLRKEYEGQEAQKRIDDLMATISQSKEELVATKTSRDHLQARVNELTIELRSAEERTQRLQPLQPRLTSRGQQQMRDEADVDADAEADADEQAAARLQELEGEVAELRRELELTQAELESTKAETASYKDIAQSAEEDLNSINEAQEQYRQQMDAALTAKEAQLQELEQRAEGLSSELAKSNGELNALRDSQAELGRKLADEKRILESEIGRLKEVEERAKEEKKYHQSDLRAQAEIAAKAQKDYEQELVKHADAAKQLQQLRSEHNSLRTEAASWRAEAESAKMALSQSETSWEERRQQFEQELSEMKARREDTNAQNKLLGQQLESVMGQIASLQHSRVSLGVAAAGSGPEGESSSSAAVAAAAADTATEGLRELNSYLRREKEILEVQYNLKLQETQRLQQKVEYAQSQLDEARLKLEQERRSQADVSRSSQTHKELMEKLNELNLIRESNVTLRNDYQKAQGQLAQKEARVRELQAQLQPLGQRVAELESQKQYAEEEIRQIGEDRDRWQKRTESILSKYGQVADATEMEQLRQAMAQVEAERATLQEAEAAQRQRVEELEATLVADRGQWKESRQKLIDQAKEKARQQGAQIRELTAQKNELQEHLTAANMRLAAAAAEKTALEAELSAVTAEKAALEAELATVAAATASATTTTMVGGGAATEEAEEAEEAEETEEREEGEATSNEYASAATADVPMAGSEDIGQVAQLQEEVSRLEAELLAIRTEKAAVDQELADVRSQLETALRERDQALERGGANNLNGEEATAAALQPSQLTESDRQVLEQRVAAAEANAATFEQKAKEVEDNMQAIIKERSDKMKDALNRRLKDSKEKGEQELREAREKIQAELEQRLEQRLEQEKKAWQKAETAGTTGPKPENAEQAAPKAETPAGGEPQTLATQATQATPATPATPAAPALDLSKLGDAETRDLLSSNPTIRSIVTANIKKKIDQESRRMREELELVVRGEFEAKIASARETGQMMAEKKSSIRINMAENKLKTANAKLEVVSTAAQQTPQRPVIEVWTIAKDARPAPAVPATPSAATVAAAVPAVPAVPATPATPATPAAAPATPLPAATTTPATNGPAQTKPAITKPPAQAQAQAQARPVLGNLNLPAKPVAPGQQRQQQQQQQPKSLPTQGASGVNNPFGGKPAPAASVPNPFQKQQQQQNQQQTVPGQQNQNQQPAQRSAIPVPGGGRGGANTGGRGGGAAGRGGGVYQAPRGGRGGGGRGGGGQGRGGGNAGASAGPLNAGAEAFNPGNKRPRVEGDGSGGQGGGGGGGKRMRGGGGGGGGGGGQQS